MFKDRNTFGGWLDKREEVGAQHLICVSTKPIPDTIKNKAKTLGETVRFIELQNPNDPTEIPLQLLNSKHVHTFNKIVSIEPLRMYKQNEHESTTSSSGIKMEVSSKIFSRDKEKLISICDMVDEFREGKYPEDISITIEEPIFVLDDDHFIPLRKLSFDCKCQREVVEIPPTVMSYKQLDSGVLAWVLEFSDSDGRFNIKLPAVEDEHGDLVLQGLLVHSEVNAKIALTVQNVDGTVVNAEPESIDDLGLRTRTVNVLKENNICKVSDLTSRSETELSQLPQIGKRSITAINDALASRGLSLPPK